MAYYFYFEVYKIMIVICFVLLFVATLQDVLLQNIIGVYFFGTSSDPANYMNTIFLLGNYLVNAIIIRVLRRTSENKIINDKTIYMNDWTEDKFSLLLDSIPSDVTKDELRLFLEVILTWNGEWSKIKDIIYLQDCEEYVKKKRELKMISQKLAEISPNLDIQFSYTSQQEDLLTKKEEAEKRGLELEKEAKEYKLFKGKAIVIFETIAGRSIIEECLPTSSFSAMVSSMMWWRRRKMALKGSTIKAHRISEPKDVYYENLHLPESLIMSRNIITVLLSALVVLVGMIVLFLLSQRNVCINQLLNTKIQIDPCNLDLDSSEFYLMIQTYLVAFFIISIGLILPSCNRYFNNYRIHLSESEKLSSYLNYVIVMNYFTNVFLFMIPLLIEGPEEMLSRVIATLSVSLINRFIIKH